MGKPYTIVYEPNGETGKRYAYREFTPATKTVGRVIGRASNLGYAMRYAREEGYTEYHVDPKVEDFWRG